MSERRDDSGPHVVAPALPDAAVLDLEALRVVARSADEAPSEGPVVLLLDRVDRVEAPARALAGLMRRLARPERRIAVVAPRARVRGSLLAALHSAGVEGVKVVAAPELADAWLGLGANRASRTEAALAEIRERLSHVSHKPRKP